MARLMISFDSGPPCRVAFVISSLSACRPHVRDRQCTRGARVRATATFRAADCRQPLAVDDSSANILFLRRVAP